MEPQREEQYKARIKDLEKDIRILVWKTAIVSVVGCLIGYGSAFYIFGRSSLKYDLEQREKFGQYPERICERLLEIGDLDSDGKLSPSELEDILKSKK